MNNYMIINDKIIIPEIIIVGIHVPYVKGYIVSQNEWQVKTFLLFQLPITP